MARTIQCHAVSFCPANSFCSHLSASGAASRTNRRISMCAACCTPDRSRKYDCASSHGFNETFSELIKSYIFPSQSFSALPLRHLGQSAWSLQGLRLIEAAALAFHPLSIKRFRYATEFSTSANLLATPRSWADSLITASQTFPFECSSAPETYLPVFGIRVAKRKAPIFCCRRSPCLRHF